MTRTFHVGEPLPLALSREDMADLLGISLRRFDEMRRAASHPAIKQLPGVGHPRFSGATAQRWLDQRDGERKYFNKKRKAS